MDSGEHGRDAEAVHEVEFALHDPAYPFVGVSGAENCRFELAELLPRAGDRYGEFFVVTGADPQRILRRVAGRDGVDAHFHDQRDDGVLFEFLVSDDCPAVALAELGAVPRTVRGVDGRGRIVAEIPERYDSTPVVEKFLDVFEGAELAAKRERDQLRPLFPDVALRQAADRRLTDRQWEVLRAAYEAGYYDWPRECTGKEVADDLGITSSTFSQHVQAAERNLLALLLEDSP